MWWKVASNEVVTSATWTPAGGSPQLFKLINAFQSLSGRIALYALSLGNSPANGVANVSWNLPVKSAIGVSSWNEVDEVISSDPAAPNPAFVGTQTTGAASWTGFPKSGDGWDAPNVPVDDIVLAAFYIFGGQVFLPVNETDPMWLAPPPATAVTPVTLINDDNYIGISFPNLTSLSGLRVIQHYYQQVVDGVDVKPGIIEDGISQRESANWNHPMVVAVRIRPATGAGTTPVDNALTTDVESLQVISRARPTAVESIGATSSGVKRVAVDSLQGLSKAELSAVESLQGLSDAAESAVEGLGGLSPAQVTSLESLRSHSVAYETSVEGAQGLSLALETAVEARQLVSGVLITPVEADSTAAFVAVSRIFDIPVDSLQLIVPALFSTAVEGFALVAPATFVTPVEGIQRLLPPFISAVEGLQGITIAPETSVESLQGISQALDIPVDSLMNMRGLLDTAVEASGLLSQALLTPVMADGTVGTEFFNAIDESQFQFDSAWITSTTLQLYHWCQIQTGLLLVPAIARIWNLTDGVEVPGSRCITTTLNPAWDFPYSQDIAPYLRGLPAGVKTYRVELGALSGSLNQPQLVWAKIEKRKWNT